MAIERIEQYENILKIILKPTKRFPNGYFYTDNNEMTRKLISNYSWLLNETICNTYVSATIRTNKSSLKSLRFHQEYAYIVLGYHPSCIDHINRVELDNRDINLNIVSNQQNSRNRPTKCYYFAANNTFRVYYILNNKVLYSSTARNEYEACLLTYSTLKEVYKDYNYNFYLDRKDDLDILDLELTGQISEEEAVYRHVLRYADNAWYYYRYGLEKYFRENHIPVPDFDLDSQGFMIDRITRKHLCPLD